MTPSTIKSKTRRFCVRAGVVLFWLLVWQAAAMAIGQEILLVSPLRVMQTICVIALTEHFWFSIFSSFFKILCGYLLALLLGTLFAGVSYVSHVVRELLYPLINVMKSTPVASFVVLALLWIRSENLSVLISFLMAFPIVYQNLSEGLDQTDRKMLEMASVFCMKGVRRVLYIYIPSVSPFFVSAASLSVGLCWKSGIAAEIIGIPKTSIGGALYQAKLFLSTGELFAWTLVIILISIIFEKTVLTLLRAARRRLERM